VIRHTRWLRTVAMAAIAALTLCAAGSSSTQASVSHEVAGVAASVQSADALSVEGNSSLGWSQWRTDLTFMFGVTKRIKLGGEWTGVKDGRDEYIETPYLFSATQQVKLKSGAWVDRVWASDSTAEFTYFREGQVAGRQVKKFTSPIAVWSMGSQNAESSVGSGPPSAGHRLVVRLGSAELKLQD
jgi:hypothetical protein